MLRIGTSLEKNKIHSTPFKSYYQYFRRAPRLFLYVRVYPHPPPPSVLSLVEIYTAEMRRMN